jgi:hypothetical protein
LTLLFYSYTYRVETLFPLGKEGASQRKGRGRSKASEEWNRQKYEKKKEKIKSCRG